MVLSGAVNVGDRITVDAADGQLHFDVVHGAAEGTEAREPAGATGS
jgi:hypothetical protein